MSNTNVIILMGASGCGKTTVGRLLSERLAWPFYDGDDFHPAENVARMAQGLPLTDRDRLPWLLALRELLAGLAARGGKAVLACSALKQEYRDGLMEGLQGIRLVYLKGEYGVLEARLRGRQGHFFKAGLLAGQFEILEEPENALVVRVDTPPASIVDRICLELSP